MGRLGLKNRLSAGKSLLTTSAIILLGAAGCNKAPQPSSDTASNSMLQASNTVSSPLFEDITSSAGLHFNHILADGKLDNIVKSDGAGGVIFDCDNDGFMDVYVVNSGPEKGISNAAEGSSREPNRLFRNKGNGTFEDITEKAGVAGHGFGITAAAADYDNDGDIDLYVVNYGGGILYQNQGNGTFTDVTAKANLVTKQGSISAAFFDYDLDGHLDLFIANYLIFDPAVKPPPGSTAPYAGPLAYAPELNQLFRNRGDGTFEDVSEKTGIRIPGHRAMSVACLDYDLDGYPDLYISNDATANLLLANDGKGKFTDVGLQSGAGLNQFGASDGSMGATVGDCNGDGFPDLFVTRFGHASLYMNSKGGLFEDRVQASGILDITSKYTGWGGNFFDYDSDGDLDLFIANGHAHFMQGMPPLLLENQGSGSFKDASLKGGPFFRNLINARGSGVFDMDNDGKMDILITTLGSQAYLLRNKSATAAHWIIIKLEGTQSNRDAFGAKVRLTAGGKTSYAEMRCPTSYVFQQDPRLHFGLGPNAKVERIEIRWPSGKTQTLTDVAVDNILRIKEP